MEKKLGKEIAVLLATYNGARFLVEQLDSLRAQTCQDFVCYIHDDGSSDGTQQIITDYCSTYPDQFVYLGCSRTGGAKYNFMYLLHQVEAPYYMFCDQDDVWKPEKIEKTYKRLKEIEENDSNVPACVFSIYDIVDKDLNFIGQPITVELFNDDWMTPIRLLYFNPIAGCTMIFNRSLRNLGTLVDVSNLIYMHDWLLLVLVSSCGRWARVKEALIMYRQHGDNVIGAGRSRTNRDRIYDLFHLYSWLKLKRDIYRRMNGTALAALSCLETYKKENLEIPSEMKKKIDENIELLRKFIHKMKQPLLVKIFRAFCFRFGLITSKEYY